MSYQSTKKYGHEVGLSCAFRQWRAGSHCRLLHGYALSFEFTFEADELDARHWVVDFGGLKGLKGMLENAFDHKTVVAHDDPEMAWFLEGAGRGLLEIMVVDAGGCEAFARLAFEAAQTYLHDYGYGYRVRVVKVEVREHGANGAIYYE